MFKHETTGPKLFLHDEKPINVFHDQLLLNGLDQSIIPSSPLFKQKNDEIKNPCFKSEIGLTIENLSRSDMKNNASEFKIPKEKSFFSELRKLKLVKIAITKLNNFNTFSFVQRLRKVNYQIIGDNAKEFNERSSLQVFLKKKNKYFNYYYRNLLVCNISEIHGKESQFWIQATDLS